MKRRLSPASYTATGPTRRARQPQISCDFCRHKKLKCGTERPCPNCVVRNQPCQGSPAPPATPSDATALNASEILERLRRLEQAVFPAKDAGAPSESTSPDVGLPRPQLQYRNPPRDESGSVSADLNYPEAPDLVLPGDRDAFTFRFAAPAAVGASAGDAAFLSQWRFEAVVTRCVSLPAKEDALALLDYFLQTSHFLPQIFHKPTTISIVTEACSPTSDIHHRPTARMACTGLTLSICATAAFFWEKNAADICRLFPSEEDASRQGRPWLRAAWNLLDQLRRIPCSESFEEVQANVILSDLIYNIEGCSTRYRSLHHRTLAIAREISLHLIDAQPASNGVGTQEDEHQKEERRRVWWHIASSNWLLSVMGGPLDRVYSVNPQHMMVNMPANINFSDLSSVPPDNAMTDMTYFCLRIRLAETCRKVTDAFPLGSCEITDLPYDRVLAISRLFDDAHASMPHCYDLDTIIPAHAPASVRLVRRAIHLGFHARRARIFRPFLLSKSHQQLDPRFKQFRALCLHSARVVVELASGLVAEGLERGNTRTQWSGCVISHLFIACVVLVTHPAFTGGDDDTSDSEVEGIRAELAGARRLLERAAGVSSVTENLVRKLVDVLKQRGVVAAASKSTPNSVNGYLSDNTTTVVGDSVETNGFLSAWLPAGGSGTASGDGGWDSDLSGGSQPHIDGLEWTDLAGAALPDADGWNQLFADLDAAFPAPL